MPSKSDAQEDNVTHLRGVLDRAIAKLRAGMESGPFGEDVALTTEEATMVYRFMQQVIKGEHL